MVITRVANVAPGGALAATGMGLWMEAGTAAYVVGALAVVLGLVLGVRGYRMGVHCGAGALTVRRLRTGEAGGLRFRWWWKCWWVGVMWRRMRGWFLLF
ncbi:hypothetical protein GCM10009804_13820 [Kribbella hippodromi]|uniref:Uncharacterized protein n=1 Tax=Kribbella hippodromi TaxID=434347 RepID=A0ABP4NFY8_9ACTN